MSKFSRIVNQIFHLLFVLSLAAGLTVTSFLLLGVATAASYRQICKVEARYQWEHYLPVRKLYCHLYRPAVVRKKEDCGGR
jgi:hypothetical protein